MMIKFGLFYDFCEFDQIFPHLVVKKGVQESETLITHWVMDYNPFILWSWHFLSSFPFLSSAYPLPVSACQTLIIIIIRTYYDESTNMKIYFIQNILFCKQMFYWLYFLYCIVYCITNISNVTLFLS